MKLLDTNVVLYAYGRPHAYKAPSLRILLASVQSNDYGIDVELLQEVMHVLRSRGELNTGLAMVDDLLDLFPRPFPIERYDIVSARALLARHPTLAARDAIHAAVVLNHHLEGLVSADRDFDEVREIVRFDPMRL